MEEASQIFWISSLKTADIIITTKLEDHVKYSQKIE
jgi:hypothetical protein